MIGISSDFKQSKWDYTEKNEDLNGDNDGTYHGINN
jgi:hypothetical protein